MTKKTLALSLGILASVFLAALPVAAEESSAAGSGFFQDFYQAILDWIAPSDEAENLAGC